MAEELHESAPVQIPVSLGEVLADLQGFGIEEFEEILTISSGPKELRIKISTISTEEDIEALLAVEGTKDYAYFQGVKAEVIARAISWINGVDLRGLKGAARIVVDPKTGERKDFRAVLRDTVRGWGMEVMQALWKILMVHMQTVEDRLFSQFPDALQMRDVERRYLDRFAQEIEEATRTAAQQGVAQLFEDENLASATTTETQTS